MRKYLNRQNTLGVAFLGVVSVAFAAGCADETSAPKEQVKNEGQALITGTLLGVSGCNATAQFDIRSNKQDVIQWVAIDQSDVRDLRADLKTVDEANNVVAIDQRLVEADTAITALLDTATNSMSAAEISRIAQRQDVSHAATTSVVDNADHSDTALARQAAAQQSSQAQSSAFQSSQQSIRSGTAAVTNSASGSATTENILIDNAFVTGSAFSGAFGGWMWDPLVTQQAFSNTAHQDHLLKTANLANNQFLNSNSATNAFSDSLLVNQRADQASQASQSSSSAAETTAANRASHSAASTVTDVANSAAEAFDEARRQDTATATHSNAVNTSHARNVAFTNLQNLASHHLIMNVNFTAQSARALLRSFTGNSAFVLAQGDLSAMFNQCVVDP